MPPERFSESGLARRCWTATAESAGLPRPRWPERAALRFLYILVVYLAAPVVSALLAVARPARPQLLAATSRERFGFGARCPPGGIWLHAVSVGEVQAARRW